MESDNINQISIIICLYTGVRIGELCGLRWSDIDFERRLLQVQRTVHRIKNVEDDRKTKVICLLPKSDMSNRDIPLPDFLISFLKEHCKISNSDYVVSSNKSHLEPRTIQRRFKRMLSITNLRDINFHTGTRHTFATRALEKGFDIKVLSEILGHSSVTFTLNKYANVLDDHKRKSMELLEELYK